MTVVRGDESDRLALLAERDEAAVRLDELLLKGEALLQEARRTLAELDETLTD